MSRKVVRKKIMNRVKSGSGGAGRSVSSEQGAESDILQSASGSQTIRMEVRAAGKASHESDRRALVRRN